MMKIVKMSYGYALEGKWCPSQEDSPCGEWCPLFEFFYGADGQPYVELFCGKGRTIKVNGKQHKEDKDNGNNKNEAAAAENEK